MYMRSTEAILVELVYQAHSAMVYMTKIMHSPHSYTASILTRDAYAGKLESWENLTCNSNSDNDPDEAPSNCSHA